MSALLFFACVTKSDAGAFLPTSMHLNPAFLRDLRTISLGVMCMSGSRVPITIVPIGFSGSSGSFSIMDFNQDITIPSIFEISGFLFVLMRIRFASLMHCLIVGA